MKKVIILLTTLLSLNLFGGLVHKDVDTRVKFGIGYMANSGSVKNSNFIIEGDIAMKTNVYTKDIFSVYTGGKLKLGIIRKIYYFEYLEPSKFNFNLIGILGTEEKYKDVKFYQQLGMGIGYNNIGNSLSILIPDIELGLIYNDVIFALDVYSNLLYNNRISGYMGGITLSAGYEF